MQRHDPSYTPAMTKPPSKPMNESETKRVTLLEAYEARTDLLLSALALVYLVTFSAQAIFYEPDATWFRWSTAFGNLLWVLFALDLIFRLSLSPRRWYFIKTHLLDVITVVVPQFRALRVLRAFTSDGVLSKGKGAISGKAIVSATIGVVIVVWVGSLMVLSASGAHRARRSRVSATRSGGPSRPSRRSATATSSPSRGQAAPTPR